MKWFLHRAAILCIVQSKFVGATCTYHNCINLDQWWNICLLLLTGFKLSEVFEGHASFFKWKEIVTASHLSHKLPFFMNLRENTSLRRAFFTETYLIHGEHWYHEISSRFLHLSKSQPQGQLQNLYFELSNLQCTQMIIEATLMLVPGIDHLGTCCIKT